MGTCNQPGGRSVEANLDGFADGSRIVVGSYSGLLNRDPIGVQDESRKAEHCKGSIRLLCCSLTRFPRSSIRALF